MATRTQLYKVGQLVRHLKYGYRGVIVEADAECRASDDWYESNKTQPDKLQPWYHIIVSESDTTTYAAQSSICPDESLQPIQHNLTSYFFLRFEDGHYLRNERRWPSNL